MSWNNGYERRKFEEEQKRLAARYRAAGMSEEDIRLMYIYDLGVFNDNRRYYSHNQSLQISVLDDDDVEGYSPLNEKFLDELSVSLEDSGSMSRHWWIEEIEDAELIEKLRQLDKEDIELLTMVAFDGRSQREIAQILGMSQRGICKRILKIKNFIK